MKARHHAVGVAITGGQTSTTATFWPNSGPYHVLADAPPLVVNGFCGVDFDPPLRVAPGEQFAMGECATCGEARVFIGVPVREVRHEHGVVDACPSGDGRCYPRTVFVRTDDAASSAKNRLHIQGDE